MNAQHQVPEQFQPQPQPYPAEQISAERIHGGPDRFGIPRFDFSTNSNACGPCLSVQTLVAQADASHYPDATYTQLRRQIASLHGVDAPRVVLAASASEFIYRITAWLAQQGGRSVWVPQYSYGDYAHAAHSHRVSVVAEISDAALRWSCEPSSPLGVAHSDFEALLKPTTRPGMFAANVLDRAYEPLRLEGELALSQAQLQTFWQLWSPNKALGLTGVRAAYAIAPVDAGNAIETLEQLCPSWPLGAHGVALLQAWIGSDAHIWLARSLDILRGWKVRQIALCESLGWTCLPSNANFFCAQPALPAGVTLPEVLGQLRTHGIKLRDATSFGLSGHVRVSVQPPAAQDALLTAWQHIMKTSI